MVLIEHDGMVEALPPDAADQPFSLGILPGALGSGNHLLDAHTPDTLPEATTIYTVPIQ
jgi:hypothetical protein